MRTDHLASLPAALLASLVVLFSVLPSAAGAAPEEKQEPPKAVAKVPEADLLLSEVQRLREEYNEERPHGSLEGLTPFEFFEQGQDQEREAA
jgi:transposase InsO family protein